MKMPRREWTLAALWSLILLALAATATNAASTEDILNMLNTDVSSSDSYDSTTTTTPTRSVTTSPPTTTRAPAPPVTTAAPVLTTQAPAPTQVPAPLVETNPVETAPATEEPVMEVPAVTSMHPTYDVVKAPVKSSNTTAKASKKEEPAEESPMPKAVARAKPSDNNTYVWIVAGGGIAMTVASMMVVSLKRKIGTGLDERDSEKYARGMQAMHNADDAVVTGSMIQRLRNWSLPSIPVTMSVHSSHMSSAASHLSSAQSRLSSELFVVDESEDGDDDTRSGMFAIRELTVVTDLSNETPWNGRSPTFATRTTRSASCSTVQSTATTATSVHEFTSFYSPQAKFRETTDPVTNTKFSVWM